MGLFFFFFALRQGILCQNLDFILLRSDLFQSFNDEIQAVAKHNVSKLGFYNDARFSLADISELGIGVERLKGDIVINL